MQQAKYEYKSAIKAKEKPVASPAMGHWGTCPCTSTITSLWIRL